MNTLLHVYSAIVDYKLDGMCKQRYQFNRTVLVVHSKFKRNFLLKMKFIIAFACLIAVAYAGPVGDAEAVIESANLKMNPDSSYKVE